MVFYQRDMQVLPSYYNKLLYVTDYVCNVELRHVLVDLGSSLTIKVKNGHLGFYINFCELNKAWPKDEFFFT